MKRARERLKGSHWIAKVTAIFMLLIAIGFVGGIFAVNNAKNPGPKLDDIPEDRLEAFLIDTTKLDIREVKIDKPNGLVSVSYFEDDISNENNTIYIIARDSVEIMPKLFTIAGVKSVKVIQLGIFLDEQGNRSVEPSVAITMTREKADKINWDEVNSTNRAGLIALASELYIDRSIRSEISEQDILNAIITQLSTN